MELIGSSAITGVVVHARGALVTRRVSVAEVVPDGDVDIAVPGVTVLAEGASVRAALSQSKRSVVSVQSALAVPAEAARASVSVERLQELENRLERARSEINRLSTRRTRLIELRPSPRFGRSRRDALDARFADALAFTQLVSETVEASDARILELQLQVEKLNREYQAAALEHAQLTSGEKQGPGHPTRQITVRLAGAGPLGDLDVTYAVPAARWWPLYTLRLADGGRRAALALEALVAQRSGEDWSAVPLALSTADLLFDAQLPELPSLHLGRAQAPRRPAFRPPPQGLDRLFEGYDRVFGAPPPQASVAPPPPPLPPPAAPPMEMMEMQAAAELSMDEEGGAPGGPPPQMTRSRGVPARPKAVAAFRAPMPPPMPMSAPMPSKGGGLLGAVAGGVAAAVAAPVALAAEMARSVGGFGGAASKDEAASADEKEIEPSGGWLDFGGLRLAEPQAPRRGRLVPGSDAAAGGRAQAQAMVEQVSPREQVSDPRESRGHFDYRYELEGRADIPSDGLTHRLLLSTREGTPAVRFRSVPHDDAQVFREVALTNPFPSPLLAGPVEVYVEGSLLTTSALERVDQGGPLTVGMGVEERVKVARNVRAEEENAGLLGGSVAVTHTVSIDLTSSLSAPAELELIDRLPVTDEKGVEVKLLSTSPEATPYKQDDRGQPVRGGLRWKLTLGPGEKKHLELKYRISFSAKDELVGGNRRD